MNRLIKLHDKCGRCLLVDADNIKSAITEGSWSTYTNSMIYYTNIMLQDNITVLEVKETPDQIYDIINGIY